MDHSEGSKAPIAVSALKQIIAGFALPAYCFLAVSAIPITADADYKERRYKCKSSKKEDISAYLPFR